MARKQLTYTELRVAVFVLATVALLILGIFYVTGAGAWQAKYELKTYLPEAETLVEGAPVSLGGVAVGNVTALKINPNAATPDQNVEIDMSIFKKNQNWIRADSTATLLTQGALGNRYVTITRGSPSQPVIPPGGIIRGVPASTIQTVVEHSVAVMDNLNGLAGDLRGITGKIQNGQGTMGKFLNDPTLYNNLNATVARANTMLGKIQSGQGTAGKLYASDELYNHANSTVVRLDSLVADVQSQKGTLGKMIYDPALYNNANSFLAKGNSLLANVQAGQGSLGKLATDPALYNNLRDASAEVRDLGNKLNLGEGSAGKLVTDTQLYNNLTGLSGDLRLLVGDIRRQPKKYLRIHLGIF
ncbi:MAG TPA: MlaD family protein [Candidatus Acidoferrales bacterium]|nr:MlaD family protein [Candidatus Acidoferrales bacterium]